MPLICVKKPLSKAHAWAPLRFYLPQEMFVSGWFPRKLADFASLLLPNPAQNIALKVVTSEKIGGSGVMSTLGTWYGGVVMGVLLPFNEAAILYRHFNCVPLQKQKIIVFAANNSRCCE
jgi:hypothetical protein